MSDAVTLQIIRGKLEALAREMGVVLARSAMSPVIYEVYDFGCGISDAKLITGALNPAYFAAGRFDLDIARARTAVSAVADRLGGTTEEAANAIVRLAEANVIDDFGDDGRHEATVYERDLLPPDFSAPGPLVIEEPSSTTLVQPGQTLRVDAHGFLRIAEAD